MAGVVGPRRDSDQRISGQKEKVQDQDKLRFQLLLCSLLARFTPSSSSYGRAQNYLLRRIQRGLGAAWNDELPWVAGSQGAGRNADRSTKAPTGRFGFTARTEFPGFTINSTDWQ